MRSYEELNASFGDIETQQHEVGFEKVANASINYPPLFFYLKVNTFLFLIKNQGSKIWFLLRSL